MVLGELEQFSFAKKINAAVANVGDADVAVSKTGRHEGRAHAGCVLVRYGILENGVVGVLDGFGEKARPERRIAEMGILLHGRLALAEISEDGLHGKVAGDFTGGVATHSVAYHENAEPLVVAEAVLIGGPHSSDIAQSCHF